MSESDMILKAQIKILRELEEEQKLAQRLGEARLVPIRNITRSVAHTGKLQPISTTPMSAVQDYLQNNQSSYYHTSIQSGIQYRNHSNITPQVGGGLSSVRDYLTTSSISSSNGKVNGRLSQTVHLGINDLSALSNTNTNTSSNINCGGSTVSNSHRPKSSGVRLVPLRIISSTSNTSNPSITTTNINNNSNTAVDVSPVSVLTSSSPDSDYIINLSRYPAHYNPPGPPPAAPEVVVSNPAALPRSMAVNHRFHSRPVHPMYLRAPLIADTIAPAITTSGNYTNDDIYIPTPSSSSTLPTATEFNGIVQVPARYVDAINSVQGVNNGHAITAIASPTATVLPPLYMQQQQQQQQSQKDPTAMYASALLGPLSPYSGASTLDWNSRGVDVTGTGHVGNNAANSSSVREYTYGQQQQHYSTRVLDPERAAQEWMALLVAQVPLGRRGWNLVGRDHLSCFSNGMAPVSNYAR